MLVVLQLRVYLCRTARKLKLKKHLHLLPMPRTTAAAKAAQAATSAGATAVVNILRRSRVGPAAVHFGLILN